MAEAAACGCEQGAYAEDVVCCFLVQHMIIQARCACAALRWHTLARCRQAGLLSHRNKIIVVASTVLDKTQMLLCSMPQFEPINSCADASAVPCCGQQVLNMG
jgi:hypothetical protein